MAEDNIKVHHEDILITQGAQQALDLLSKIFINPGENIIIEAPSYVGAINAFNTFQPNFITIPLENDGIDVKKLENYLKKTSSKNHPKFIYFQISITQLESPYLLKKEKS